MLHRYGTFIHRHARLVLIISAVALIAAAVVGLGAFGKLKSGGFDDPASDSTKAQRLVDDRFGGDSNLVLLVHAKSGTADDQAVVQSGRALTDALKAEPGVRNVASYWSLQLPALRSTDGTDAIVLAHIDGDDTHVRDRAEVLIDRYATDRGPVTVRAGGRAGTTVDVNGQVGSSLALAEGIAVPLTLILLILVFGSVVSALLPLIIGGVAIMGTFAELFILGSITDVSIFAINLTTALGLGLGIDYALFMVSRFREQLAAGDDVEAAVARTVATAGRTILFAAATVGTALAALLVFPLYFLRSFSYAGMGVVVIAATSALVIAPALLSVLGPRVNKGRLPGQRGSTLGRDSQRWGRIAAAVMRRPALAALPVVAGLLVAASPLLHITFGTPDAGVLNAGAGSRTVADRLTTGFAGNESAAITVVVDGPVERTALTDYAKTLSNLSSVVRVESSASVFVHGDAAGPGNPALGRPDGQRLAVVSGLSPKSDGAQDLVKAVRSIPAPGRAYVGGDDAQLVDTRHSIGERLPIGILLIVLTTFVLLFLFTGSVLQPIRALVLNVLSLSATMGVLTWMFQDGHLAGLFGFTPRPMDTAMMVLLFCIAFGLSMDYEVFVISRISELHEQGASTVDAVRTGLARTGRIVSAAAGLLAVTFFAFATSSVSFLQMFGIGSGLAILIDATLIRGVLVPALVRVLGPANWWAPAPLRWVHARLALREA
jgi:putative drug exporter of the RND superfamily